MNLATYNAIMRIEEIKNEEFVDFIANSQLKMALETENFKLDLETVKKGARFIISHPERGSYYIAFDELNQPKAMLLALFEWSDWRSAEIIWIHSVWVEKDARAKGLYKQLYSHIQNIVKNNSNFAGIRLYVDKTNSNAVKVYEKLGMNGEHYSLYEWMK